MLLFCLWIFLLPHALCFTPNQPLEDSPQEFNELLLVLKDQVKTLTNETGTLIKLIDQRGNESMEDPMSYKAPASKNVTSLDRRGYDAMDQRVRDHILKVYRHLAIMSTMAAVGAAAVASGIVVVNPATIIAVLLLSFISTLGFAFTSYKAVFSLSDSFFTGIIIAFTTLLYGAAGLAALPYAIGGTVLIFVSFTLAAILGPSTSFLKWGGILISMLLATILVSLMNLFLAIPGLAAVITWTVLVLFSFMIGFDTQKMIENAISGSTDYVSDAFSIFKDIANILVRLLDIIVKSKLDKSS